MELITGFVTIVGLLADYVSERRNDHATSGQDFEAWLAANRHEEILRIIQQNQTTSLSIKALLNEGNDAIVAKLQRLDETLASVATGFESFKGIAAAVTSENLPEQALSVLTQCTATEASRFLRVRALDGLTLVLPGAANIKYTQPQFIEDDLATLVKLGLLRFEAGDRGIDSFWITRAAANLVGKQSDSSSGI